MTLWGIGARQRGQASSIRGHRASTPGSHSCTTRAPFRDHPRGRGRNTDGTLPPSSRTEHGRTGRESATTNSGPRTPPGWPEPASRPSTSRVPRESGASLLLLVSQPDDRLADYAGVELRVELDVAEVAVARERGEHAVVSAEPEERGHHRGVLGAAVQTHAAHAGLLARLQLRRLPGPEGVRRGASLRVVHGEERRRGARSGTPGGTTAPDGTHRRRPTDGLFH